MTSLNELYQEIILDHNRSPKNFRAMKDANRRVEGYNPLCGDHYTVYVKLNGDVIEDVSFDGSGCAISKASASVMSELVKGQTRAQAALLFDRFHRLVTGEVDPLATLAELGKLAAFSGVAEFPMRVKCATLAWHSLHTALESKEHIVSTE
jgi:nitrogen fixation NifU-like protein